MAVTVAYPQVREVADKWEDLYASAVISGIVGDKAHARRGGYHIGRCCQSGQNFSVVRPDDRFGPADAAAGVDMTMSKADMIVCTKRLRAVWENKNDPRRKYINACNGWLGSGAAIRLDVVTGARKTATPDHKWHVHLEIRRRWVTSRAMVVAVLSILAGETVAEYLKKIGAAPAPAAAKTGGGGGKVLPAPKYPGRILRRNDRQAKPDAALKAWQARMLARGWKSIGKADGFFGARTESVVRRFQATCGIGVDGQIGPATWPKPWTRPLGS